MDTIVSHLNSVGESFIDFVLPMLIQSSILIVILLGLDFVLRKKVRAVFRYCIWMLVLVKLVLPTSLASPCGIMYWLSLDLPGLTNEEPVIGGQPQIIPPPIVPMDQGPSNKAIATAPSYVDTVPRAASIEPEPVQSVTTAVPATGANPITWQAVVFLVWLSVLITMVLLLLQRLFFVRGLIGQSQDAGDTMADTLGQCCQQMSIKRKISLKLSSNTASPSVCGLLRPTILIPADLPSKLNCDHLKAVLLHELAHIKRSDLWVSFIQTILQIIYFYNPLLWLANSIIRQAREQAVDEMVQVAMGEKAENYPQTLVNVFRLSFSRPALGLRLIGVVESKSSLRRRVKHILNRPIPKTAKLGIMGLLAILITAAVLLPMATANPGPPGLVIKGVVTDAQSGQPIAGAKVFDDGYGPVPDWDKIKANERSKWGAITNSKGQYSFLTWPEHHSIKVEVPGYKTKQESLYSGHFSLNKKDKEIFDFALVQKEGAIDEGDKNATVKAIVEAAFTGPEPGSYSATLPNGVTVELIGICEHPTSEGKQWWRPDGSLLKQQPYDSSPATLLNSTYKYEFVYRLSGSPGLLTTLGTNKDFGMGMGPRCLSDTSEKIYLPDKNSLYSYVRESMKALKQGDITILVGNESDWATVTAMESPSELGSVHTFDAIITSPLERNGITYVDVVAPKVTNQARVIAVDKQGHKHIGRGYSGGSTFGSTKVFATGVEFPLPLSDIQSIEYQTQDFVSVTFKNVSLQGGHKTAVQVEVAGLTKRFPEWVDWQNMTEYSGIVQNQNGESIQKVKVRAVWKYPVEPLEITEFTDNQGRFNIILPKITKKYSPSWVMFFEHPDYALGWLGPEERTRHKDPKNLEIILYQPTTVSGIVENSEGEPVADAQIYADIEPTPESKQNYPYLHLGSKDGLGVKTDNNGRFVFEKIPVWAKLTEIMVEAKEKGYVSYSAEHKDKEFSVAAGTNNLIFTLETAGTLRGRLLLDAKPYPREGVRIYAWDPNLPNPNPYSLQWTETDNTGQFEIKGVPQGNYTVTFAISPSSQLTEEKLENIRVTPTKTTYVEFDLRKTILDEKSGQESLPTETKPAVQVELKEKETEGRVVKAP